MLHSSDLHTGVFTLWRPQCGHLTDTCSICTLHFTLHTSLHTALLCTPHWRQHCVIYYSVLHTTYCAIHCTPMNCTMYFTAQSTVSFVGTSILQFCHLLSHDIFRAVLSHTFVQQGWLCRHAKCQTLHKQICIGKILPKSASIMANARSQQNSANDVPAGVLNWPGVAGVVLQTNIFINSLNE